MTIRLTDLKVGEKAKVVGFSKDGKSKAYRQKLLAMGLTISTEFQITRLAPMGDPVEIRLRGFSLTLRKDEADALQIEAMPN